MIVRRHPEHPVGFVSTNSLRWGFMWGRGRNIGAGFATPWWRIFINTGPPWEWPNVRHIAGGPRIGAGFVSVHVWPSSLPQGD